MTDLLPDAYRELAELRQTVERLQAESMSHSLEAATWEHRALAAESTVARLEKEREDYREKRANEVDNLTSLLAARDAEIARLTGDREGEVAFRKKMAAEIFDLIRERDEAEAHATLMAAEFDEAEARGRAKGIEEAARLADFGAKSGTSYAPYARRMAENIRSLLPTPAPSAGPGVLSAPSAPSPFVKVSRIPTPAPSKEE